MNAIQPPPHEARLAALLGEASLAALHSMGRGLKIPVPIVGTPYYLVDGKVIAEPPRMQDVEGRRLWERPDMREAARPIAWGKGGKAINEIAGGMGWATLADLIAANPGKAEDRYYRKGNSGTTVVDRGWSYWNLGTVPAAGGVGGTTGTGAAKTRTSTGAFGQRNAPTGDTLHITNVVSYVNNATGPLLIYDRLWDMTHTMTVDPRSCDAANVPTRYQTATTAPGSFISGEVTTILPAATPTVTFDYVDQDGNNVTGPALSTIASAAAVDSIPFTAPNWFYPLDAADTGVRSLQNGANAVNLSAAMASGVVSWFIGHPLIAVPSTATSAQGYVFTDGINSCFNLQRVYDDACIAFLEPGSATTNSRRWEGWIKLVAG